MASIKKDLAGLSLSQRGPTPLGDVTGDRGNTLASDWKDIKREPFDYEIYKLQAGEQEKALDAQHIKAKEEDPEAAVPSDEAVPIWASDAMKYEWQDEYGDVGPAHKELEDQLFRDKFKNRAGSMFDNITKIKAFVECESEEKVRPVASFEDAGLHPVMVQNIALCGYRTPTPIQAYCIPAVLNNYDVLAIAQTGSGKTAAFLIPVLSKLMGKAKKLAAPRPRITPDFDLRRDGVRAEPLVLIVCPTRELATQIFDEARRLCYRSMLRPCVAYGGAPSKGQKDELRKGCDILIATPGRLMDFMRQPNLLSLARVRYTIIDEADEMVDNDWNEEMKMILSGGDNNEDVDHRYMMFSATFPKEARQVAKALLAEDHVRIRVGRIGSTHENIKQDVVWVEDGSKPEALVALLRSMPPARTLIFVNNKTTADWVDDHLFNNDFPSTSLHSARSQLEREDAMRAFKAGRAPIMIATGVSARGIDIINVMHVINYELPSQEHEGIKGYIHRIGRTGRIGNNGLATSFFNDKNFDIAEDLVKILLEGKQEVPDFLQEFKPENVDLLDFGDDSDDEENLGNIVSDNDPAGDANPWGPGKNANDDSGAGWEDPADSAPAPDKGKGKVVNKGSSKKPAPLRMRTPSPEPAIETDFVSW